jgi:hypothetical protein
MNDRDVDRAEAVRQIAAILAAAYVRLRFPDPSFHSTQNKGENIMSLGDHLKSGQ